MRSLKLGIKLTDANIDDSIPMGNLSPALLTASGIVDGSFLNISCFGTPTFPTRDEHKAIKFFSIIVEAQLQVNM